MMRLWIVLAALSFAALALLISFVSHAAALMPPHPMLATFERCDDTFCWLGIEMTRTTPSEAEALARTHGYRGYSEVSYQGSTGLCDLGIGAPSGGDTLYSIQLFNCPDLQLGDVWAVFGTPDLISNDCFQNWVLWYDAIAVFTQAELSPRSPISQIAFYNLELVPTGDPLGARWHGFAPQWRYNQLEPNIRGC